MAFSFVGTINYMSPERLDEGNCYIDADIWSLGIILLECAEGKYPYENPDNASKELGFWELLKCIKDGPPPKLGAEFSDGFRDFISICLRKKAGTRSSATELLTHPWIKKYEKVDKKHL